MDGHWVQSCEDVDCCGDVNCRVGAVDSCDCIERTGAIMGAAWLRELEHLMYLSVSVQHYHVVILW